MNETIYAIIIGLATGMVSGLVSGYIVTKRFRNKDIEKKTKDEKVEWLNDFTDYLEQLLTESELLENSNDYNELHRLIKSKSQHIFKVQSIVVSIDKDLFVPIISNLHYIENGVDNKSITPFEIKNKVTEITKVMLKVWMKLI